MEKTLKFHSPKLKIFFLFLLTLFCNGSCINQAGPLRALRRAKMRSKSGSSDEKWETMMTWNELDGLLSSNVGKFEDDLIAKGLPGQPLEVKFKQYGGYINVDESKGRSLFYYFAEAQHNSSSKPLVLWLNGGPGCSSLGVGAMAEIGPFRVNPDGLTLYSRQFAWNKVANILFLESPAGVGFSYSNTTSDYDLSGDSRTGFYIPELADVIIKKNKEGGSTTPIQLKGIMIGNGIMNDETDIRGFIDYLWSHALISDETHNGLLEHCNGSSKNGQDCDEFEMAMVKEIGDIDFYSIYSPTCPNSSNSTKINKRRRGYDPCEENYVHNYTWEVCSPLINDWKDSPSSMFSIYKRLISSGLQIFLFSGDMDAVVPVTGTRYSIDALNLKVIKAWNYWLDDHTKEVAGYQVIYDGLIFTTIKGAGHEVPRFQPRRALALLSMLLQNHH